MLLIQVDAQIPPPNKSAFTTSRTELEQVLEEFQGIIDTAPHNRDLKEHVDTLENAVFRSWEALSKEEIQDIKRVVNENHARVVVGQECHIGDPQAYLAFVEAVMAKAANTALCLFCTKANKFVEKYIAWPDAHAQAKAWTKGVFRNVGSNDRGWNSLSPKGRQIVSDFLTGVLTRDPLPDCSELVCLFPPSTPIDSRR
ncbi:hypothetical protein JCM1840_003077 [Sporobolomyces johnsonii]